MTANSTNKPFIIENADKLVLLFVPYFIILSCLYYYGYWGEFNINAFSYLETQDLIKGAIFQIRNLVPNIIQMFLISLTSAIDYKLTLKRKYILMFYFVSIIILYMILTLYIQEYNLNTNTLSGNYGIPSWIHLLTFCGSYFIALLITPGRINSNVKGENISETVRNMFYTIKRSVLPSAIAILIAMPILSYYNGHYEAKAVLENKYFNYYSNTNISDIKEIKNYTFLKYIGKAGKNHFFTTPNNKKIFVIDETRIPVLTLENYNVNIKSDFKFSAHK